MAEQYELSSEDFELFGRTFLAMTGMRIDGTRRPVLARVLSSRLKLTDTESVAEYCQFVTEDQPESRAEIEALVKSLAIKETCFFRNEPQWEALREHILPELIAESAARQQPLRVWSAGCSTGEEPYTLALLLKEHFSSPWVQIHATDIDPSALEKAAQGEYSARSVRRMDRRYLDAYFHAEGERYVLDKAVRKMVRFSCLNLADAAALSSVPDMGELDLVLCRNVIMYFPRDLASQLLARIAESLREGGCLVLGHAEMMYHRPGLQIEQYGDAFFYRKTGQQSGPSGLATGRPEG